MIQKVLVTPIIGLPQINGWAQVTQSSDGQFICSFSIHGSQAGNVGRDLVDLIKDNSPNSATAVYSLMKKIVRFIADKDCELEISSSFFGETQTIFSAYNGSLLLKRNGKVGSILFAEDEIKVIEGKKNAEDIFVLLTNSSLEFKGEILQKLSQGLDADTTVASIVPGVQNLENSSLIALAFLSDLPLNGESMIEDSSNLDDDNDENTINDKRIPFEGGDDEDQSDNFSLEKQPIFEASAGKKKFKLDKEKVKQKLINISKFILSRTKSTLRFIYIMIMRVVRYLRQLFTNEVYVDKGAKNAKKKMRIFILGFFALLLILIPIFIYKLKINSQVKAATVEISGLLTQLKEVKLQVESNPIESRETIASIIDNLESKSKAFSNKKSGQKYILGHLDTTQKYFDSISGKEIFQELDVFFDFQLVESDFIANRAELVGDKAYFFDQDKNMIVELELGNKKVNVISLDENEQSKDIAVTKDSIYLLRDGVFSRDINDDSLSRVIDEGKANREATHISLFNDNVYVLNPEQRNVFKYGYNSSNEEYSAPIRWVKSAKDLEFNQVYSMEVDGNIWLTTKSGQIFKLSTGEGSLFEVNGLVEPLSNQLYIMTKPEYQNIYLLEPSSSRIVIINKNGDFVKEIKSISLASASGFVVSEALSKAIVISGSLVFEVGL